MRTGMATGDMAKKMLIDATHPEETRVVVADGNKVDDFDFESINKRQLAGNIYLAKVTRVEPSLQAAFVDYGGNRHGFLAFSEIHPDYYQIPVVDREALLAEEEAEQKRSAASEDERDSAAENDKSRARSRRGKRRTRGKQADKAPETTAESSEIARLEVIDLTEQETGAEAGDPVSEVRGLEIADVTEPANEAESAAPEAETNPEGANKTVANPAERAGEVESTEPEAEAAEPAAEDTIEPEAVADKDTQEEPVAEAEVSEETETPDEPGQPPRSIAESTGLDDEETISEDILDAPTRKSETEEGPAPEATPAPEPTPESAAEGTEPEPPAEEPAEAEATPEEPEAEAATEEPEAEAAAEEPEAEAAAEETAPTEAKPARTRHRRGRGKKAAEELSEPTAETEDAAAESGDASDDNGGGEAKVIEAVESIGADETQEEAARARARRRRHYKVQDVIKVRQIMLVQVVKEERGNKGAALTTYLSLAGRYCVLMPNTARGGGISRKITSAGDRKRLREVIGALDVPHGMGLIVRTAGAERTRAEIKRDYEFLLRQWEQIRNLTLKSIAPTLIYEEGSLIKRSIRDLYSKEIDAILVEGEVGYREAKDYMKMLMPSHAKHVQQYTDQIPLFIRYQVESYLNGMFSPVVQLRSGGYIVIGVTEALVAIDVNSGRSTKEASIEETALKTNLEAADEVARQLRLRDLAGLIVIDFIDMQENRNNRAVEKRMKERLKSDRARIQVGRISGFGLMEMSRQRLRPGMLEATTQPCPHCQGQGITRSDESLSLSILREVAEEGVRGRSAEVTVTATVQIANYIMNMKRAHLASIEQRYGLAVSVLGDPTLTEPRIERSKSRLRPAEAAEVMITAESAVSANLADDAEVSAETPEEGDERRESRSQRRRGRRGGQRRRRDDREATPEGEAETGAKSAAEAGEVGEEERKERRSRRRRGGRGRRRRQDEAAQGAADAAEADAGEATEATADEDAEAAESEIAETEAAEAAPETVADEVVGEAPAAEPEPVVTEEPAVSEEPTEAATEESAEEVAEAPEAAGEEPAAKTAEEEVSEPEPAEEPELVAAPPAEPESEPEKPAARKRRGGWSRG